MPAEWVPTRAVRAIPPTRRLICVGALLVMSGCGAETVLQPADDTIESPRKRVADTMPLARRDLSKCVAEPLLRPACPTRVPKANERKGFFHRSAVEVVGHNRSYLLFEVEWGAARQEELNQTDKPPRFSHILVHAGDLAKAFDLEEEAAAAGVEYRNLGKRTWAGRTGGLTLAPPYPIGGFDGGHLIFKWSENNTDYALSMHAWLPLREAERALRDAVESARPR